MKNKGLTFFLLIFVGIIWYKVFYRFRDNFVSNQPSSTENSALNPLIIKDDRFDYVVTANYRDPFGLMNERQTMQTYRKPNLHSGKPSMTSKRTKVKRALKQPMLPVIWPEIRYHGTVRQRIGQGENSRVILKIGKEIFMPSEGERFHNEVMVHRIYRDSVSLKYKSESKILSLKKD